MALIYRVVNATDINFKIAIEQQFRRPRQWKISNVIIIFIASIKEFPNNPRNFNFYISWCQDVVTTAANNGFIKTLCGSVENEKKKNLWRGYNWTISLLHQPIAQFRCLVQQSTISSAIISSTNSMIWHIFDQNLTRQQQMEKN
jgi:hypothetical protein